MPRRSIDPEQRSVELPRHTARRPTVGVAIGCALLLVLTGCGRDDQGLPVTPPSQQPTVTTSSSPTPTGESATPSTTAAATSTPTAVATSTTVVTSSTVTTSSTATSSAKSTTSATGQGRAAPAPPGWTPAPITPEQDPTQAGKTSREPPPEQAGLEALVVGCRDASVAPSPERATEYHVGRSGRAGIGLVLTFDSASNARAYLAALTEQLMACPTSPPSDGVPGVTRISRSSTQWLGRRDFGGDVWSEIVVVSGSQVRMWILQDPSLSPAQMTQLASQLAA